MKTDHKEPAVNQICDLTTVLLQDESPEDKVILQLSYTQDEISCTGQITSLLPEPDT